MAMFSAGCALLALLVREEGRRGLGRERERVNQKKYRQSAGEPVLDRHDHSSSGYALLCAQAETKTECGRDY